MIYIGTDHTDVASGRGRNSVRLSSKKTYTRGLIILDLQHMPGGQCGSWPALYVYDNGWSRNEAADDSTVGHWALNGPTMAR